MSTLLSTFPRNRKSLGRARGVRRTSVLWLTLTFLPPGASGCAKVGDPLPPVVQLPSTIHDLRAVRAPSGVELYFRLPSADVRWVEIYRQCDAKTAVDRVNLIARLAWEDLKDSGQPGVFVWDDRDNTAGPNCRYALRFVNQRGLQSEPSNFATIG